MHKNIIFLSMKCVFFFQLLKFEMEESGEIGGFEFSNNI